MNQGTNLGSQTGRWIILAALVAVLGALLFLLPGGIVQGQQTAETYYYPEKGDEPVVTLAANDPEDVTPIYWEILTDDEGDQDLPGGATGANADDIEATDVADHDSFTVEDGVLTFKDMLPDFENPPDTNATDNTYKVVVKASDGGMETWVQYFKVTVIVTDVEETGKVTWTVDPDGDDNADEAAGQDLLEFQAGAQLSATVTDPDGPATIAAATTAWRWYRSSSMSATGTMITDENGAPIETNIYDVSDASDNNDVGMYLRAVATYTDRRGANKTAQFVSPHRVRPARVGSNTVPKFAPTNFDRQVQEGPKGMTVGGVVKATDADGDVLNYTLTGTIPQVGGVNAFEIDQATGQITTAVALNYDGDPAPDRSFTVMVRATDSAGGETGGAGDLADATVTIILLDVNEAPVFADEDLTSNPPVNIEGMAADRPEEGIGNMWTAPYTVAAYTVTDPEGVDIGGGKWSLSGDDAAIFKLTGTTDNTRTLEFREKADFEMPGDSGENNIYEVTVVASDGEEEAMRSVTVKITDSDEAGKITLSTENPVTGTPVKATLTDSDGDVINIDWKWYALTDAQVENAQEIATAIAATGDDSTEVKADDGKPDSYTPTSGDITKHLLAVATYMDRTEDEDNTAETGTDVPGYMMIRFNNMAMSDPTAPVIDDPANAAPMFVEGDRAVRYVEEDDEENRPNRSPAETIGAPLTAMDDDGDNDSLTYTLGGADAASFNIEAGTGQLMTKAMLDYDRPPKRYTVVVTVKDGSGASNDTDRITVTIEVKDLDEKPDITGNSNFDNHNEKTSLVGTLMATDPERVTPIYWEILQIIGSPAPTVDGTDLENSDIADRANFAISQAGVLTFKDMLPDFENPPDTNATDNTYKVVVKASDGGMETWVQYFKVTVIVTDVEETGKVTWTVDPDGDDNADEAAGQDLLEFQAGAQLSATVTDPDGPATIAAATTAWRWYRSSSMSATGTMITDENGAPIETNIYDVSDTADNNDVGMYLRAVAIYTDRRGANKTAQFVSPHRVRPARVEDNALPKFAPTAHARRVQEGPKGMTVGGVVKATDADGDVLNYTLTGTIPQVGGVNAFEIDQATGQITTAVALNYDGDPAPDRSFTVMVRATDSAGGETGGAGDLADATVTIILLDVNEAPVFADEDLTSNPPVNIEGMAADRPEEGIGNMWTAPYTVAAYTVTDPEGVDIGGGKWSLSGDDAAIFKLTGTTDNTRTLEFREKADFEMPGDSGENNIYEVTVVASDGEEEAMRSVTVKITDSDEAGKITLSTENPVTGTPVKATLTDSDGDVINIDWKWYALTDAQVENAQEIATAIAATGDDSTEVKADDGKPDSYTPTSGDITKHLLAVATYMDRTEDEDNTAETGTDVPGYMMIRFNNMAMSDPTAPVTDDPANAAPMFVEGDRAVRYVEEDDEENRPNRSPAETIGAPLTAMDDDNDSLTYTLGGADAASFNIEAGTGQLMTKAMLNYEMEDTYTVVVTVDDGSTASNDTDRITVTIEVKDLDEKPILSEGGLAVSGLTSPNYMENDDDAAVATYTAIGSMAGDARWSLEGEDAGYFRLDPVTGMSSMLSFRNSPNYEMPRGMAMSDDNTNTYMVTVTATDGTYTYTKDVMVMVTDVVELGMLTADMDSPISYMENDKVTVGTYTVDGLMAATATWTLEGADASHFTAMGGMLKFSSPPDYEMPRGMVMSDDNTNAYMVTVKASAGGEMEMMDVTIMVTNMEEDGTVTLMPTRPSVGTAITAILEDPDIVEGTVMWQWASADAMDGTFTNIDGATMYTYTPVEGDAGMYLRAMASYTDGYGADTATSDPTESAVTQLAVNGPDAVDHPENTTSVKATYAASGASGPVSWTVSGDDAGAFTISGGMLTFNTAPNFEAATDANTDNMYNVTVVAMADGNMDTHDLTVTVRDMDEDGSVTGLPASAMVGDVLTASLEDEDSGVANTTWQWASAGIDIDGATSASYTVADGDEGMSLMATATYDDVHGTGKMVSSEAVMVAADTVGGYDTNKDGIISVPELFVAVDDYFAGGLTIPELFEVIDAYFAS